MLATAPSRFAGSPSEVALCELWVDALEANTVTIVHPLYLKPWTSERARALEAAGLDCPSQALEEALTVLTQSTAFPQARRSKSYALAFALAKQQPLNTINAQGLLPLVEQVKTGWPTVIEALMNLGADPFLPDAQGDSAVSVASAFNLEPTTQRVEGARREAAVAKQLASRIAAYRTRHDLAQMLSPDAPWTSSAHTEPSETKRKSPTRRV